MRVTLLWLYGSGQFFNTLARSIAKDSFVVRRQNTDAQVLASNEKTGACMYYFGQGSARPNWDKGGKSCIKYCADHGGSGFSMCDYSPYNDVDFTKQPLTVATLKDEEGYIYVPCKCKCNDPTIEGLTENIFDIVAEGLSKLDNILCAAMLSALQAIVEVGIFAIPGGAELQGARALVQGAKTFTENGLEASSFFGNWIGDACGVPDYSFDLMTMFTTLVAGPDSIGTSVGCKIPKGKGTCKPPPKVPDKPKPTLTKPTVTKPTVTKPTVTQATTQQTTAKTTTATTTYSTAACKRAVGDVTQKDKGKNYNVFVSTECNQQGSTVTHEFKITSLSYSANAKPTLINATCKKEWSQACYHYSSAISVQPAWKTLTCPPEAAVTEKPRFHSPAVGKWKARHPKKNKKVDLGWWDKTGAAGSKLIEYQQECQVDEFPPMYLLSKTDTAIKQGGSDNTGQLVRLLPDKENGNAANGMWAGICFRTPMLDSMTAKEVVARAKDTKKNFGYKKNVVNPTSTEYTVGITVDVRPEFTIAKWEHETTPPKSKDDGLSENPCWPKVRAKDDPGYTVQHLAQHYIKNPSLLTKYDYKKAWVKGTNGSKRALLWSGENGGPEMSVVGDNDDLEYLNGTLTDSDQSKRDISWSDPDEDYDAGFPGDDDLNNFNAATLGYDPFSR
ncbi:hypothetical protein JX266_013079 [Neoarthrinium moseri]|nr:hypothetical protein JX266_013079 [Neoarthrinium moseri]